MNKKISASSKKSIMATKEKREPVILVQKRNKIPETTQGKFQIVGVSEVTKSCDMFFSYLRSKIGKAIGTCVPRL